MLVVTATNYFDRVNFYYGMKFRPLRLSLVATCQAQYRQDFLVLHTSTHRHNQKSVANIKKNWQIFELCGSCCLVKYLRVNLADVGIKIVIPHLN